MVIFPNAVKILLSIKEALKVVHFYLFIEFLVAIKRVDETLSHRQHFKRSFFVN